MGVKETLFDLGYTIAAPVDLNKLCELALAYPSQFNPQYRDRMERAHIWIDDFGKRVLDSEGGR